LDDKNIEMILKKDAPMFRGYVSTVSFGGSIAKSTAFC